MKNMTFRKLKKFSSNDTDCGTARSDSGEIYFSSSKSDSLVMDRPTSSSDIYNYKTLAYSGGTLPRNYRKGAQHKWKPQNQSPEQCRKVITLEKGQEESFGFEIQTYGLHRQDENSVEMCTFICKVHENSPAQRAGLRVGDTIASVNESSVDRCRHKDIVQLIRSSGNCVRLETVYSDAIRKAELEARLQYLKQTLHEKWDEYRSLMKEEQRLVHGLRMNDAALSESLESVRALVYGSLGASSPASLRTVRCMSSASSSASQLSGTTEDDALYQTCLYPGEQSTSINSIVAVSAFAQEEDRGREQLGNRPLHRCTTVASSLLSTTKTQLTRSASTRSYLRGAPPLAGEKPTGFGSLPRKPKQMSFRRRLLKFIPGLNRALEEEESKL
ncbi:general receptor for phosphoinositides 1-associated scaffold protein isoform X1 [Brienomyrus brachyistius]|uniref:general receptor for phosphoinositides 1-associated scaffold protein isoform X1 n=1 Tax=Brienomyrus brachyistius TaxID=42636 RepID=UPI0020B2E78F|nr:general receptor for phosphoinositides 1-associated scaffold protein isoform X1 [Brienomyrus brachyistius]